MELTLQDIPPFSLITSDIFDSAITQLVPNDNAFFGCYPSVFSSVTTS
jgi:hypothetical protein